MRTLREGPGLARGRGPLRWLRELGNHLRTEHATPGRLAAAVGVGLFVGTQPLYGLHLPICVALALALRLNKVTTYLAANISNPFLLPVLTFAAVQLGARTLGGAWLPFGVEDLARMGAGRFVGAWIVGSVELGTALAAVGAAVTWGIARAVVREDDDPWAARVASVAARYAKAGRWAGGFARGKLRGDPVYRFVAEQAGTPARVVDVGCGHGLAAVVLAEGGAREVVGFDWDAARVAAATRAAEGLPVRVEWRDVREATLPDADLVLVLDVLHYLAPAEQDALIQRAARAVRPGGRVWMREMVRGGGLRSFVGIGSETVLHALRWSRAETLSFRTAADVARGLSAEGLVCEVRPMWKGTPYANVLVEGRRPVANE